MGGGLCAKSLAEMGASGAATRHTPLVHKQARSERVVVAYLALLGILLAFGIDAALPAFDELREAFGLEPDSNRITLIITLYFMGLAFGQLFYGPISDRFGRQPAVMSGVAVYCLGALGSIFAPSFELLLVARLVWGLGAASMGVLRTAIARDLYEGDQMARVISTMMGFFMMGPVVAPIIGDGILEIASWEWIFGAGILLALVVLASSVAFGETLDPEQRRPFDLNSIFSGFRIVFGTRSTLYYTMALTSGFGAFIVFLGSSQPVIDNIYDRGDQFSIWFAVASIAMAIGFFIANSFIDRYGAHRVAVTVAMSSFVLGGLLFVIALATSGVPAFGIWFVLIALANLFTTILTPTCYALGLEPMGELAGTASAVMGFISTAGGSLLAALIDASIDDTVTPMGFGYVFYGGVAVIFLLLAGRANAAAARTVPSAPAAAH